MGSGKSKFAEKTFVVFQTAAFGDSLLCNALCQNIKIVFPESKVVFVCDKPFYDIAKYQKDVNEVVVFDKKGKHKGLFGILRFLKEFPYKKPYASFITYKNTRNCILAWLLGSKYVLKSPINRTDISTQEIHILPLKKLTDKEIKNVPIKFLVQDISFEELKKQYGLEDNYIVFNPSSKNPEKDMPLETAKEVLCELVKRGYSVVFTGAGEKSLYYAEELKKTGAKFVDLTNKTDFMGLAQVLKNAKVLLSIDTGTLHLGYSVGVPTVAVFYRKYTVSRWAPDTKLYNAVVLTDDLTVQNICDAVSAKNI